MNYRANLLVQILANDKLMADPDMAEIMKALTNMEEQFNQPLGQMSEAEELSSLYRELTLSINRFIKKHEKDKKKISGMDYVKELSELIKGEESRFKEDLENWS